MPSLAKPDSLKKQKSGFTRLQLWNVIVDKTVMAEITALSQLLVSLLQSLSMQFIPRPLLALSQLTVKHGRTGFETQFQACNTHLCTHLTNKCLGCWHLLSKVPYVYNLIVSTPSYCTNACFHALASAVVALSYKQTTTNTAVESCSLLSVVNMLPVAGQMSTNTQIIVGPHILLLFRKPSS